MKDDRPKVIVVDDVPVLREAYARNIERAGFNVHSAGSRDAAIEAVNAVTYNVALVDIMLSTDDEGDRSGFDVIREVRRLSEGTRCVAISGYPGYSAPAQAANIGVDRYIPKADIHNPPDYVEPVRTESSKSELRRYGQFDGVIDYIAAQGDYHIWESQCLRELGLNAIEFHQFGNQCLPPICPLLPVIGGSVMEDIRMGSGVGRLVGWSKGLGMAVEVVLCRDRSSAGEDTETVEQFRDVFCVVKRMSRERSAFISRAADVKRKKRSRDRGRSTLA